MTSPRIGTAAFVLMFACAAAQSAGSALFPLAVVMGLHSHGHPHLVSVVSEEGHLDLVFAHTEGDDRRGDRSDALAEGDHVVHLTGSGATTSAARRPDLAAGCMLAVAFALPLPAGRSSRRPPPKPRARGTGFSRLVVLRL